MTTRSSAVRDRSAESSRPPLATPLTPADAVIAPPTTARPATTLPIYRPDPPTATEAPAPVEPCGALRAQIDAVTLRLVAEFGATTRQEDIERRVVDGFVSFDGSRIRSFIPVLVERMVRARLRALGSPSRSAG